MQYITKANLLKQKQTLLCIFAQQENISLLYQNKMEEVPQILSRKNSGVQSIEKQKIGPQIKIDELHDLIQGYLYNNNEKKLTNILPQINKVKQEMACIEKERRLLNQQIPSQSQMAQYEQIKKNLAECLQRLSKQVESSRTVVKRLRIRRKQLQNQYSKNQQLMRQLKVKYQKMSDSNQQSFSLSKNSGFPKISNFYLCLNKKKSNSRLTHLNSSILNFTSSQSSNRTRESKECFFNSINFRRLKQIDKMLDQISTQSPTYKLEKLLVGDKNQSILKKVFKKFSINQFFDKFIAQKSVIKYLLKIEKL